MIRESWIQEAGAVLQRGKALGEFLREHQGHRVQWGHWYRAMKRRIQPPSLVFVCKDCGSEFHRTPHPKDRP